jgi:hypothetical protein
MDDIYNDDFFNWGEKRFSDYGSEIEYDRPYGEFDDCYREDDGPWRIPWPKIPNGGEPKEILEVIKNYKKCPCEDSNVMGYYIPWHFKLEECYRKNKSYLPSDISKIDASKPECNRWGIHLCLENIKAYIDNLLMPRVRGRFSNLNEEAFYRDYALYLLVMKTLAHEWGHYRSEVLAIEQQKGLRMLMGIKNVQRYSGNYLTYFRNTVRLRDDFEEVFAEWCALRLGVFNFKMIRPDNAPYVSSLKKDELTKDWLIRSGLLDGMKNNIKPYADIVNWVDFNGLQSDESLENYVEQKVNLSKLVGKFTDSGNQKIIDLVMHNINYYSKENYSSRRHSLIRSGGMVHSNSVASMRNSIGYSLNPQAPTFDISSYGNPSRVRRALYLDKPLRLKSFVSDIYRLPLKNYNILPVKVYH